MHGNYDAVAPFYDFLARAVFGSSIRKSQAVFLPMIPKKSRILIIGGGSGRILEDISNQHHSGFHITYVEISEKMIARAKKRETGNNQLCFLNKSIQDADLREVYDIIITPFLFDNFSVDTLQKVFKKLDHHLKKGGLWLFSDFQSSRNTMGQKIMLKMMYGFFSLLCKLETTTLHDPSWLFQQYAYTPLCQKTFYRGFISSLIYQKRDTK